MYIYIYIYIYIYMYVFIYKYCRSVSEYPGYLAVASDTSSLALNSYIT